MIVLTLPLYIIKVLYSRNKMQKIGFHIPSLPFYLQVPKDFVVPDLHILFHHYMLFVSAMYLLKAINIYVTDLSPAFVVEI